MNTLVGVRCNTCGKMVMRCTSEVRRSTIMRRRFYCSRKCCGKQNYMNLPRPTPEACKRLVPEARRDKLTPFRYFLRQARKRKEVSLSLEDLKNLWESQQGICPYTGWRLELPFTSEGWKSQKNACKLPSLDRIDSSKGYVHGNVQFVARIANYAKNMYTDNQLIEFCHAVSSNSNKNPQSSLTFLANGEN